MEWFLLVGTLIGAGIGLLHAPTIYRDRLRDGHATPFGALYFAAWALALWTFFGAYLLAFWLLGALWMALDRALNRKA